MNVDRLKKFITLSKSELLLVLIAFFWFNISFINFVISAKNDDFFVLLTFYFIGGLSLLMISLSEKFISIYKMFFCFVFMFLYYAPIQQYTENINLWGHVSFNDALYLYANSLILLSLIIFILVYFFTNSKNKVTLKERKHFNIGFITLINMFIFIYMLLSKQVIGREIQPSSTITSSIEKIIRFFPVAVMFCIIYDYKSIKKKKILIFIDTVIFLVLFFPLAGSISRFLLFSSYIFLFSFLFKKIKNRLFLPIMVIVGFQYIFPLFNFFKYHSIFELAEFKFTKEPFLTVDFDAYQLFLETILYTRLGNGFVYGKNIISSFLFFIPRSIWEGKSLPSGQIVAEFFGANFTNLSCPYIGEMYLSFGVFGIFVFSLLLALTINVLDTWLYSNSLFKVGISSLIFAICIFIFRGSLLPTYAYTCALLISFITCYFMSYKVFKIF